MVLNSCSWNHSCFLLFGNLSHLVTLVYLSDLCCHHLFLWQARAANWRILFPHVFPESGIHRMQSMAWPTMPTTNYIIIYCYGICYGVQWLGLASCQVSINVGIWESIKDGFCNSLCPASIHTSFGGLANFGGRDYPLSVRQVAKSFSFQTW